MRVRRQLTAVLALAAVAAGAGLIRASRPAVGQEASAAEQKVLAVSAGPRSVTLITGDRVVMSGGEPRIMPRPGGRVKYLVQRAGSRLLVIPSDAVEGLRSGRLDTRLFDVAGLLDAGFGDAVTDSLPLIVTGAGTAAALRTTRSLPSLDASVAVLRKADAAARWSRLRTDGGAGKIWLDGRLHPLLDHSRAQIGADRTGRTGRGVKVAVLDTGLDRTHPDFAGRVDAVRDFTGTGPDDEVGHGTHVAGIVAGAGTASGGRYRGIAPEARLLIGKVCSPDGCAESAVIAGMEWAAAQGAKVVNLSLGGPDSPGEDPLESAIDELSRRPGGPVFVVAAGNEGRARSINSPASADEAVAVGAVDGSDQLAEFSSRGPRLDRGRIKPDIVAPGVGIVSTQAGTGGYVAMDGTSMATPHVTGVVAQLAEQFPDLSGSELKNLALSTAKQLDGLGPDEQGAGRVDAAAAVAAPVVVTPALQDLGVQRWPHTDDQPVTTRLTYHNPADKPIELALRLTGPAGTSKTFQLGQDHLTVPARGSASVQVVASTNHDGADGRYHGTVTATSGDRVVRAQLIVDKEPESYDVTIHHLDRTGADATAYLGFLRRQGSSEVSEVSGDPTVTMRLAKGIYSYAALINDPSDSSSYLYRPHLVVDRDLAVSFDGRLAKPIKVSGPDPAARVVTVGVYHASSGDHYATGIQDFGDGSTTFVGQQGPDRPVAGLRSFVTATLVTDRPAITKLVWSRQGRYYTGVDETAQASELAAVDARITAQGPDRSGVVTATWTAADGLRLPAEPAAFVGTKFPATVRLYLHTKLRSRWSIQTAEVDGNGRLLTEQVSTPRRYRAGTVTAERWNEPVYAPAPGQAELVAGTATFDIPQFGDSAGHVGRSRIDGGSSKLYRGDDLVAETADPGLLTARLPGSGRYRLDVETRRTAELSSSIRTSWTFTADGNRQLPLWMSRWRPMANGVVGLDLVPQPRSRPGRAQTPEVAYSTDAGRTWHKAVVIHGPGNGWQVRTSAADTLSLRLSMTDTDGNGLEQTVIDALPAYGNR